MKRKKPLAVRIAALIGITVLLQSCTTFGNSVSTAPSNSSHASTMESTSVNFLIQSSQPEQEPRDVLNKKCCKSGFIVADSICISSATNNTKKLSITGYTTSDSLTYDKVPANYPGWHTCSGILLDNDASVQQVSAYFNEQGGISVFGYLPSIKTSDSADESPQVYTYNKGKSNDTLFVVVTHGQDTTYNSNYINFDITTDHKKNNVELFLISDDPKTSRGTVTTVQNNNIPPKLSRKRR
ncbi:MAG: hypothetical protein AB8B56_09275 [Crocinitomicaceae bacterium]